MHRTNERAGGDVDVSVHFKARGDAESYRMAAERSTETPKRAQLTPSPSQKETDMCMEPL